MSTQTQATKWTAQLTDGSKMAGGRNPLIYPNQANVSAVPIDQIRIFTVAHNTFSDTYYQPTNIWYHNGVPMSFTYPKDYIMEDGTVLTIGFDSVSGLLTLSQV